MADFIGIEDSLHIEKVTVAKKGTVILHFSSEANISAIVKKYQGNEIMGHNDKFSEG